MELTESHLKELNIKSLGERIKIKNLIKKLKGKFFNSFIKIEKSCNLKEVKNNVKFDSLYSSENSSKCNNVIVNNNNFNNNNNINTINTVHNEILYNNNKFNNFNNNINTINTVYNEIQYKSKNENNTMKFNNNVSDNYTYTNVNNFMLKNDYSSIPNLNIPQSLNETHKNIGNQLFKNKESKKDKSKYAYLLNLLIRIVKRILINYYLILIN